MANAFPFTVRLSTLVLWLASCWIPLQAATLERLSLDDMIQKSTAIVRGKVSGSHAAFHGSVIYTHYKIQVSERWKGPEQSSTEILTPGGSASGMRQYYSGSPQLAVGQEYVLFLWTSRKGSTYVLGYSQGVFELPKDSSGETLAVRNASSDIMLDPYTGLQVKPEAIQMRLRDLSTRISTSLAKGTGK